MLPHEKASSPDVTFLQPHYNSPAWSNANLAKSTGKTSVVFMKDSDLESF
jgi:hypothetical protein